MNISSSTATPCTQKPVQQANMISMATYFWCLLLSLMCCRRTCLPLKLRWQSRQKQMKVLLDIFLAFVNISLMAGSIL